ncbi:hypothetical protein QQP08_002203 [Theobroma cacao]|nr:hypothetical protein QQP08_002203 [Theobroma cacao]
MEYSSAVFTQKAQQHSYEGSTILAQLWQLFSLILTLDGAMILPLGLVMLNSRIRLGMDC